MTRADDRPASSRAQAWLDDNPVERLKAITKRRDGIECEAGGRNLQCPLCQWIKDRKKIDIPTNRLKIDLGKRPNTLVVVCTRVRHNQSALVRAVTKATSLSLTPRPRRDSSRHAVEQMRQTTQYRGLSPRAQALVDHLIEAIVIDGEPNGEALRSKKDWMLALDTRSSSQTDKAIAAMLASGLIGRRRTASPILEGGRPSFLYGLKCLPTETGRKWSEIGSTDETGPRAKPRAKPSKGGLNPQKPIDIVESDVESYAGVGDKPPKAPPAEPEQGRAGR
jgi:hypothetical protein